MATIHKKESKDLPNNYRPISLLPCISKIFERVIYDRFAFFFKTNDIISEKQFGFRKKHSTQNALTLLTDKLAEKIDKSETSIAIFLDLAKAFETVDHQILLEKLHHYGIRGLPLELMKSYLSGRKQCVKCDNHYSVFMDIECRVPQGSILGPLLFIIYVNDLPTTVNRSAILFADDTCVTFSSKNTKFLINQVNENLKLLNQWFISNKLTVNYTKTNYIVFSGNGRKDFNGTIKMGTSTLKRVSSIKYLGLMIDEDLNWKSHVSYLRSKISSCSNIMYKLRYLVPLESCISVYYSRFYSRTSYGIMCWGTACHSVTNPIRVLQNKVVKAMLFKPIDTRIWPLLAETCILSVNDILNLEIAKHVHKFHANSLPDVFHDQYMLVSNMHSYQTRSSVNKHLAINRTNKDIGKRTSTILGATVWNSISVTMRNLSLDCFKRDYKNSLLAKYTS